ncbi:hypothetical protein ACHAPE_003857 [Trichoderma viride]
MDKASVRVALMACFLFVSLELLSGHFATAQIHIQNGLSILREFGTPFEDDGRVLLFDIVPGSIDDAIVRAFCRLNLQLELFTHGYQHPCLVLQIAEPETSTSAFRSVNEAWKQIERLFNRIFHLTDLWRQQQTLPYPPVELPPKLLTCQHQIRADLSACLVILRASKTSMPDQDPKGLVYGLLSVYHTMASIMADTCLRLDDESVFDSHTQQFVSILTESIAMWKTGQSELLHGYLRWPCIHMSRSIVDIGWIAPLYYTALKCRIRRFPAWHGKSLRLKRVAFTDIMVRQRGFCSPARRHHGTYQNQQYRGFLGYTNSAWCFLIAQPVPFLYFTDKRGDVGGKPKSPHGVDSTVVDVEIAFRNFKMKMECPMKL